MRGDGSLFKRGTVWWMQYTQNGETVRMSAKTTVKEEAKNILKNLVKKSRTEDAFFAALLPGRATVSMIVADLFKEYRTVQQKHNFADESEMRWNKHLKDVFGERQADRITREELVSYRDTRTAAGAAPATVNRELQVIKAALTLASEQEPPKVARVPKFPWAPEDNARQVFVDKDTEQKLKEAASKRGLAARVWIEMAFTYGWRKSEFYKKLTVSQISLVDGVIRLGKTKNGDPRQVPITPELKPLLTALVINKSQSERLFPFHPDREFTTICEMAGVKKGKKDGITFHDIRRSSARNKRAAGVDTSVIMAIQGWNSDKMFRRYAIVDNGDMLSALEKEKASSLTVIAQSPAN